MGDSSSLVLAGIPFRRFPGAAAHSIIGRDLDVSHPSPGNDPSSNQGPIPSRSRPVAAGG